MAMRQVAPVGLLRLAVAEGATTPNPGSTDTVLIWSTTQGRVMEWDGTSWHSYARVHVSTTQPSNPRVGDIWVDTN